MFINPIELLELQSYSASTISGTLIKKQKRKLFADIDLSDNGLFDYKGIELTKADCEKAIEELENPDYITYYLYLAKDNQPLNDLLVNGDEGFFMRYREYSTYKVSGFVDFISPYFAPRFDKALYKRLVEFYAYFFSDTETIDILRTQILISPADMNTAFKSVSVELTERIGRIENIAKEIKDKTTSYTDKDIEEVERLVKKLFPDKFLNALPKYFQSQINQIASAINRLQNAVWKTFYKPSVCRGLSEHLLGLNIESVNKQIFEKNHEIFKKADEKEKEKANKIALERVRTGIEVEKRRIEIEKQRIEAEKRQKLLAYFEAEKRRKEVDRHQKKVRTRCLWIIGIAIGLAVIFAIWGTDGLGYTAVLLSILFILSVLGIWLKPLLELFK
jgi:hypothetical protein